MIFSAAKKLFAHGCLRGLIYVLAFSSLHAAENPNVLLICIDDLRPELNCYGVDYIQSPHIDQLAREGRIFKHHYVQAPTCGASRYALLTGLYNPGSNNGALFSRAKQVSNQGASVPSSMPAWFRKNGYTTVSVGKVSHHPGGRGGADWDDPEQPEMPDSWDRHLMPSGAWQHPRGAMHGLAHGEIRGNAGAMAVMQSAEGDDMIYPDGLIRQEGVEQLRVLAADEKPFFLAVGIIRPHLPFGAPAKYMEPYQDIRLPPIPHPNKPEWKSTFHKSGEFMKYKRTFGSIEKCDPNLNRDYAELIRKHYAACVSYADAQVGHLLAELDRLKLKSNTIIVLWGDHGWHLGEYSVWGKHTLFEEALRSPLIISAPGIKQPGKMSEGVVETVDIFPTLCDLSGLPQPEFAHGRSLKNQLDDPSAEGRPAFSYWGGNHSIRDSRFRLVLHKAGNAELYDFSEGGDLAVNAAGTLNAEVDRLKIILSERLAGLK
jgi:iduronate 2-sulfatase